VPRAESTVAISRPVGEVFAFLAEGENNRLWRPAVREIHREGGAPGVGSIFRQQVSGPMGKAIPADYRITEFEPDRLIAFDVIAGPARPRGRFVLEAAGDGTRVTFSLEAELSGAKRLMKGMVQKTMDSEVATLTNLKRVMEEAS
jgi:uncharacterized protein YndB with AHSA1/START domain